MPARTTAAFQATLRLVDKAKYNSLLRSRIQTWSSKTISSRQHSHHPTETKDRPNHSYRSVRPLQNLLRTQAVPRTILCQQRISTRTTLSRSSRTRLSEASARRLEELLQPELTATSAPAMASEEQQDSED